MKILSLFTHLVCLTSLVQSKIAIPRTDKAILCVDDPEYRFNEKRTCRNIGKKKPNLCEKKKVAETCKFSCGACKCVDDAKFFLKKKKYSCNYISEKSRSIKWCDKRINVDGVKSRVRDHCRVTCSKCVPSCVAQKITAQKFDDSGTVVDDRQAGSSFGAKSAIFGNTMTIGSSLADAKDGAIYIYQKNSTASWGLEKKIEAKVVGDRFGYSVAMSNDIIVAGSYWNQFTFSKGSVSVIERDDNGAWVEYQRLLAPGGGTIFGNFGFDVGISEDNVIVVGSRVGGMFFYERDDGGVWQLVQNVDNKISFFGKYVAIDKDFVVTTERNTDDECIVSIYSRKNGTWTDLVTKNLGFFPLMGFYPKVSLSENTIAIGLRNGSNTKGVQTGVVHILTKGVDGTWEKTQKLYAGSKQKENKFGSSVEISGNNMVVGAEDSYNKLGAAYFFSRENGGDWKKYKEVSSTTAEIGDRFGSDASAYGTTAVLGLFYDDDFTGSVDVKCFDA